MISSLKNIVREAQEKRKGGKAEEETYCAPSSPIGSPISVLNAFLSNSPTFISPVLIWVLSSRDC